MSKNNHEHLIIIVLKEKTRIYELKDGRPVVLKVGDEEYLKALSIKEAVKKIKNNLDCHYKRFSRQFYNITVIYEKYNIETLNIFAVEFNDCSRLNFIAAETVTSINSGKIKLPETSDVKFSEPLFELKDAAGDTGGIESVKKGEIYSKKISYDDYPKSKCTEVFKHIEKNIKINLGYEVDLEMVYVEPGKFIMGNAEGGDASPPHQVTISKGFYMGIYPVMQEQWIEIMKDNQSEFWAKGSLHPVENISWKNCQKFIEVLNKLKKYNGIFRLPTEAEWEYACRSGSDMQYYWDNFMASDYCWYNGNSGGSTRPVGEKEPNKFGLYDMSGNVWEWCQDWYDGVYYKRNEKLDPKGPSEGFVCVIRGGGWQSDSGDCRSACRNYLDPLEQKKDVGFRLVLFPSQ